MQKGQNWLFTPTQPFSLFFFCTLHIHISKKEHVTFIGKQHLVCSPLSLQNSVPPPSPSVVMYSPLNSKSIQHFQNFSYVT